jgi:predicted NACHT family NTPase
MNEQSIYVAPFIGSGQNKELKDFFESNKKGYSNFFDKTIQWQDLRLNKRTVVLGEPGYGKSRLFQELYESFIQKGKQCCWIELKSINEKLIDSVKQYLATERIERRSIKATSDFELENSEKQVLFLDALDEVYTGYIPFLIEDINHLSNEYPLLKIFISCRTHHVLRYETELYSLNFNCVELRSFTTFQTASFLRENCQALKTISQETLLKQFQDI